MAITVCFVFSVLSPLFLYAFSRALWLCPIFSSIPRHTASYSLDSFKLAAQCPIIVLALSFVPLESYVLTFSINIHILSTLGCDKLPYGVGHSNDANPGSAWTGFVGKGSTFLGTS